MDTIVPEGHASRQRGEQLALLVVDDSPDRVLLDRHPPGLDGHLNGHDSPDGLLDGHFSVRCKLRWTR